MRDFDTTRVQRSSRLLLGFTLIEVVISISLTAVLMAALWALLSTYLNVSSKSERRVTKTQLARSVQQQIESDLKQVYFRAAPDSSEASELPAVSLAPEINTAANDEFGTDLAGSSVSSDSDSSGVSLGHSSDDRLRGSSPEGELEVSPIVIYELTGDVWSQPRLSLQGNAFSLILDHPFRAEPRRDRRLLDEESNGLDTPAPPAEFLVRTVYVFVDRKEAFVKGLPPGLLRATFLPKELERIRKDSTADLFRLIEQTKPDLFRKTEFTEEWHDDSQPKDARTAALEQLNRSLGHAQLLEHDFINRIDYLPEVHSLRMRFYNGDSWSDEWNTNSRKQLPVAVEIAFEVDMDLPAQFEAEIAKLADTEFTVEDLQAEESADAAKAEFDAVALDETIRSAQTMAIVPPNQFIIYLGASRLSTDTENDAESSETTNDPAGDLNSAGDAS